ncbi:MAG: PilZ domain-containing protein [Pseudomonadota bacterium]
MDLGKPPVPEVDRLVTIIGVHGGQPLLSHGQVVAVSPTSIVIKLPPRPDDALLEKAVITLMYSVGDSSYTLRCAWGERLPAGQLLLRMSGEPRRGERREFIRTEITLEAGIYPVPEHQGTLEGATDYALGLRDDPGSTRLSRCLVDLSGSGVRIPSETPLKKDSFVVTVLELEVDSPRDDSSRIAVPARVVRSKPDADGGYEVALHFTGLSTTEGDLVHAAVFAARMAALGAQVD